LRKFSNYRKSVLVTALEILARQRLSYPEQESEALLLLKALPPASGDTSDNDIPDPQEILDLVKQECLRVLREPSEGSQALGYRVRASKILAEIVRDEHDQQSRSRDMAHLLMDITPHDVLGFIQTAEDLEELQQALQTLCEEQEIEALF
jgi:hypothetical protein